MRATVVFNGIREPPSPPLLPHTRSQVCHFNAHPRTPTRSTSVQGRFFSAPPALLPGGVTARPGGPELRCHSLGNFYKGREEITSPFLKKKKFKMQCANAPCSFQVLQYALCLTETEREGESEREVGRQTGRERGETWQVLHHLLRHCWAARKQSLGFSREQPSP